MQNFAPVLEVTDEELVACEHRYGVIDKLFTNLHGKCGYHASL